MKSLLVSLLLAFSGAHAFSKATPTGKLIEGFNDQGTKTSCEPPAPDTMCAAIATALHSACAEQGGQILNCRGCKILCSKKVVVKSTKPTM